MNLNAYDPVETNCTKSWINPRYKRLYSKELEYHPYYAFYKRYNTKYKYYDYYIALLDEPVSDVEYHGLVRDNKGVVKIDLTPIWYNTSLKDLKETINVSLELKEKCIDGLLYYLDI